MRQGFMRPVSIEGNSRSLRTQQRARPDQMRSVFHAEAVLTLTTSRAE
jgi:hypothetical protein